MARFINTKETIVTEAIDGSLCTAGGQLVRLDGFPHIKVMLRNGWDKSKGALVSGGGSVHEPAHVGCAGKGMLTAAYVETFFLRHRWMRCWRPYWRYQVLPAAC